MDQSKFFNAYVDSAVGIIHENINSVLQLKAQLRIANETIAEKDQFIAQLQAQIAQYQNINEVAASANAKASEWEASYHAMSGKVAHMDTLLNQVKEMKALILEKDAKIDKLETTLGKKTKPKKVTKAQPEAIEAVKITNTDDF